MNNLQRVGHTTFPALMDDFYRFTVGYEDLFKTVTNEVTQKYPPHDIIKLTNDEFVINIAVAGFTKQDLKITEKNNVLTVSGSIPKDCGEHKEADGTIHPTPNYIHKGISTRAFDKKFTLSDGMKIKEANFKDGILSISLYRDAPKVLEKTIDIL